MLGFRFALTGSRFLCRLCMKPETVSFYFCLLPGLLKTLKIDAGQRNPYK